MNIAWKAVSCSLLFAAISWGAAATVQSQSSPGPKIQVDRLTTVSVTSNNLMFLYGNASFGGASSACASPSGEAILVIDISTNAGREMARVATAAHLSGRNVRVFFNNAASGCVNIGGNAPLVTRIDLL